ncbi:MAG: hypothetical protein JRI94_00405 [Deltaproteobacteria bacterium]|nr:hypothetical protein [Deltaproteobacteria bacterium]
MSISSAFLAGQRVATQAQNQKLGVLNALIQRPMRRAPGSRVGIPGGNRSAIESFADEDKRKATEERAEGKERRLEETHAKAMEVAELETDILNQAKTEKENAVAYKTQDRIIAEVEGIRSDRIRKGVDEDALAYQEQMRHYKAYSDAIYRGDATAADKHFRGIYPGMGANSKTSVTRQNQPLKDAQGNPVLDEQGNPVLGEMKQQYDAQGNPVTEEQQQARQMGYPKHRTDGGVVSMQFGDNTPVPIGSNRLRQIHTSIHQSMMQPVGGGGSAGLATGEKISAKDQSVIMKNNITAGKSAMEAALQYAEGIPVELAKGEERDLINPKPKTAEQHQKDFLKGMKIFQEMVGGSKSNKLANRYGLTGKNFLTPQAAKVAASRVREMFDGQAGKRPDLRMIMQSGLKEYGPAFAYHMAKEFKAELTPGELDFEADSPKKAPNFGRGEENVISIFDEDIGKDGFGFAIDKDLKRPMRWDKNKKTWTAMEPSTLKAYYNMLQIKAKDGDSKAQEVIQLLEAERMTPYSSSDLLKPIGDADLKPRSAISDAMRLEDKPANQMTPEEISKAMSNRTSPASRFLEEQRNLPQEEKEMVMNRKRERDEGAFLRERPY